MRIVRTELVQLPTARAVAIEVQYIERGPPRRWRLRLALWLIKLAGKLSRMRVRVVSEL